METLATRKIRVQDVAEQLRRRIGEQNLTSGTPIMSTRELAMHYNVSTLTADRAVTRLVDEGLLYRVKGSGTYVKELPQTPSKTHFSVGLASEMRFSVEALRNYTERALNWFRSHNADVRIIPYCDLSNPEVMRNVYGHLDGILLSAHSADPHTYEILKNFQRPVVLFQRDCVVDMNFHQITWNYRPSYQAVIELLKKDLPKEILVLYETHKNGEFRAAKFIEMLREAGIPAESIRQIGLKWAPPPNLTSHNYQLAEELAAEISGKFIFCTSDISSSQLLEVFDAKDLHAGRDFRLVSSDNLEDLGYLPFGKPRLTTINHPWEAAAEQAAELLLEVICKPTPHNHIIRLNTDLVIRDTAFFESS